MPDLNITKIPVNSNGIHHKGGREVTNSSGIKALTVEAWVTRERVGHKEAIVAKWTESHEGQSWILYIDSDDRPCFAIRDCNNNEVLIVKGKTQLQDLYQPYHLAGVFDAAPQQEINPGPASTEYTHLDQGGYELQVVVNGVVEGRQWVCKEKINWALRTDVTASDETLFLSRSAEALPINVGDLLLIENEQIKVTSLISEYGYKEFELSVERGINTSPATDHAAFTKLYRLKQAANSIAETSTAITVGRTASDQYKFQGSINEVHVWPGAYLERQIADQINQSHVRTRDNLQALYVFQDANDSTVRDISGVGKPLDLTASDQARVLTATEPATKLIQAMQASNELTIELWLTPPDNFPNSLARIVALSSDPANRNFSLGQFENIYHTSIRTTETNQNGTDQPLVVDVDDNTLNQQIHLVYTRSYDQENAGGQARYYLNGEEVGRRRVDGTFANWDNSDKLALGNEDGSTGSGTFQLVAIYSRALSPLEVRRHYDVGAVYAGPDQVVNFEVEPGKQLAVTVPLFGRVVDSRLASNQISTTWEMVSGPEGSEADQNIFADNNALETTATFSKIGRYVLKLTVDDGTRKTGDTVTITVTPNQRPRVVITTPKQDMVVKSLDDVILDAVVLDDGNPDPPGRLVLSWGLKKESEREADQEPTVTFDPADSEYTRAKFSKVGRYTLQLTADDGHLSDQDEVTIQVYGASVINVEAEPVINLPGSATLKGEIIDDGLGGQPGTVTVSWAQVSGPSSVEFGDATSLATTAKFPDKGIYVLRLSVGNNFVEPPTVKEVTIVVNKSPVIKASVSNQNITLPASVELVGELLDDGFGDPNEEVLPHPKGDLKISWTGSGPEPVTFGDENSLLTTASFKQNGTYTLKLTADNGYLEPVSDQVNIVVNQAPIIDAGPDQNIPFKTKVQLQGEIINDGLGDSKAGKVTIEWTLLRSSQPRGTVNFNKSSALDAKADFSKQGDYTLQLMVDNGYLSVSDEVTISVQPPGKKS